MLKVMPLRFPGFFGVIGSEKNAGDLYIMRIYTV